MANQPEYWLRGPLPTIPSLLQPVAHALLQARDEITKAVEQLPQEKLWEQPFDVASPGFHLRHLTGVLDRLFTYARGEQLSPAQLQYLSEEKAAGTSNNTTSELVHAFHAQVDAALEQLKNTNESTLTEVRGVGRAQIPSTVLGLLFHGAEHTMRHTGQLLVTIQALTK